MSKIWFTSDTHFHHKNIVRGTTTWIGDDGGSHSVQNTRDFSTLEEHDKMLINTFNKYVKSEDIVYHLGDWSFGGKDQIWEFFRQLNCKNIHLIYGNHDHHIENYEVIQKIFKSVSHYKEVTIDKQRIILSHFSMRVWNKSHHGAWMLYGHSHGTLPEYSQDMHIGKSEIPYRTMDVGVDCAFREFGEYRPYSFEEIREKFKDRPALLVDHHNSNTN